MNSAEIEQLYREQRSILVRWLAKVVRCKETAADLAQDAYIRLVDSPNSRHIASPRSYLFKTATNLAIDHFRKEKFRGNHQASLAEAEQIPTSVPSPEVRLYDKQRMAIIEQELATLSDQSRDVFVLRQVYGYSYKEIADRLCMTERAVEHRLVKAMARCKKTLPCGDEMGTKDRGENDALKRLRIHGFMINRLTRSQPRLVRTKQKRRVVNHKANTQDKRNNAKLG